MAIVKTFEAKLHGMTILSEPGSTSFTDSTITFTRSKIKLKDAQKGRILSNAREKQTISDEAKYTFSKGYNKDDSKVIFVEIDSKKFVLAISKWNKIKANIIHEQYWLQNNMDTFYKSLVAIIPTIIGGVVVGIITYNLGFSNGLKEGQAKAKSIPKDTMQKNTPRTQKNND